MTLFHRPILEALEIIARCGYDCVEIWADHVWDDRNGASVEELKTALAVHKLKPTIHCPILGVSIASPNRGIRAESVRQICLAVDLAQELGSELIVIHPGKKFSRLERDDTHWTYQVDSMTQILSYAKRQGVVAAVENMDSDQEAYSVKEWLDLDRLFSDCGIEERWVTLDATHLRDTGSILAFIEQAGPHIAHLHLSDAAEGQMHLSLGQGTLDLKRIAAALRNVAYQGVYSLECFAPNNDEKKLRGELTRARAVFNS